MLAQLGFFVKVSQIRQKAYTKSMKFGNPKQEIPQNQPLSDVEATNVEATQKAENFVRPQIHQLLERAAEEPDKKLFAVDQIATFGKRVFQGHEDILESALTKITATPFTTDEELEETLVRELASAVVAFVTSSGFSEQEAKIYFRSIMQESMGFTQLDKGGVFSFSRFEDKVDLHITEGFTPQLFQGAMFTLAQIVQGDESIKTIKMTSWVVAKYLRVIRKYGFTVDDPLSEIELAEIRVDLPPEMRDKPIAEAHMTRDEFLKKFGRSEKNL